MVNEAHLRFAGDGRCWATGQGLSHEGRAEYRVEDEEFARIFRRPLPPDLADLVDVAMAIYLSDRLVRRRPASLDQYELGWKRKLFLELPVRLLERWQQPEVGGSLRQCLGFLTDDDWELTFVRRECEPRVSDQLFLFPSEIALPVQVALFSGGLDSLAGAVALVERQRAGTLILVAGSTNPRLHSTLEKLTGDLRAAAAQEFVPVIIPLGLRQSKAQYNFNERSQRSRGFLYGTLGAVAALMAGGTKVDGFENGIGAINLPYTPAQLGSHSTRSSNPVALAYLSDFLGRITEQSLSLRLPYIFSTKAEMCKRLGASPLSTLIESSVSCDSFPLRHKEASQCGSCTSCLLRRQSLWAAGLDDEDPGDLYLYDAVGNPDRLPEKRWMPLRDMLGQVDTFRRALASNRPWDALTREYPMIRNVAWALHEQSVTSSLEEAQGGLTSLLERYCEEWERFPACPPGWRFGTPDLTQDWRFRHAS